jgi:DNA-binding NtrC family response regulator
MNVNLNGTSRAGSRTPDTPSRPERILVVDDDEEVRSFLQQLLEKKYRVDTAANVREARKCMAAAGDEIAVTICDYSMPGDNGITFMCDLRKTHPCLQRIMLTGYTDREIMLRAMNEARLFHFIVKPARAREIMAIVEKAIDEYRQLMAIQQQVEILNAQQKKQARPDQRMLHEVTARIRTLRSNDLPLHVRIMDALLLLGAIFLIIFTIFVIYNFATTALRIGM